MPKMGVNPETTKAPKPVPADWYDLKLVSLKAKFTKGTGPAEGRINYTGVFKVVNSKPDYNDSIVYFQMNNGPFQGMAMHDFCHMLGLPLEIEQGIAVFPGGEKAWAFDSNKPDNVDLAQYKGPLVGRTGNAQVGVKPAYGQGDESNAVVQIRCKVQDCATKFPENKHRLNLMGKS